ncbi:pectinesterase inhibitor [Mangifera indica]|uniref:pectinesterase inhibitor n=1 Tax=Mangifera indica TaxID=29780 RepID=UPI001CFB540D|nr:pectinesterase inhibitor [Mangifera indica]
MVSFKSSFFQASILLVMLFVAPSLARLNVMVMKGVIKDICGKTQNTSFCLGVLNQTPGASSADLPAPTKHQLLESQRQIYLSRKEMGKEKKHVAVDEWDSWNRWQPPSSMNHQGK